MTRAKFAPSASATVPATPTTTRRGETGASSPEVGERGDDDGVPEDDVVSPSASSDAPLARVARRVGSASLRPVRAVANENALDDTREQFWAVSVSRLDTRADGDDGLGGRLLLGSGLGRVREQLPQRRVHLDASAASSAYYTMRLSELDPQAQAASAGPPPEKSSGSWKVCTARDHVVTVV